MNTHNIFKTLSKPIIENSPIIGQGSTISIPSRVLSNPISYTKPETKNQKPSALEEYYNRIHNDLKHLKEEDLIIQTKPKQNVTRPIILPAVSVAEVSFWDIIDKLSWKDRSDGIIDYSVYSSKIRSLLPTDEKKSEFFSILNKYIENLKTVYLRDRHPIFEKPVKEQTAFFSHIIAKGQIFYVNMEEDPSFSLYLLEPAEYQDFHSCFL